MAEKLKGDTLRKRRDFIRRILQMAKNILILTGSPRKGGNSDKLADAFIAGAQQAGHTTVRYTTADKNIKGCIDCKTCFTKGVACSVPDDFNGLAPLVEQADMIVFATPLYWFSFPTQLKAAIDKFYSFFIGKRELKIKECALLVCAGDSDESCFEGIVASYKLIARFLNWKDSGTILVPGLHGKDDILKTDGLDRGEALGKGMF
jgi:multimeric flavodoxin WrbA